STAFSEHNTKLVRELAANLSTANHILQSDYNNVNTANQLLAAEKEEVSTERDIFLSINIVHKKKTQEGVCNSCQGGWMLFQSSCYLILHPAAPWKNWTESQQYCKQENADLAVISSQEDQVLEQSNW
ncbi:unnamed protein product, partial [Coregonus sp. 'balchen']